MKVCRGKRQARTAIFAVLIFVPAPDALTGDLIRQASIIDGDTEIHGGRIRLWGIDAPNPINEGSEHYRCGQMAANDLDAIIARRFVSCVDIDQRSYDRSWQKADMA